MSRAGNKVEFRSGSVNRRCPPDFSFIIALPVGLYPWRSSAHAAALSRLASPRHASPHRTESKSRLAWKRWPKLPVLCRGQERIGSGSFHPDAVLFTRDFLRFDPPYLWIYIPDYSFVAVIQAHTVIVACLWLLRRVAATAISSLPDSVNHDSRDIVRTKVS